MRLQRSWGGTNLARFMGRVDGREASHLREVVIEPGVAPFAHGSVLIRFGRTQVICAATLEESVPRWMKEQGIGGGWITAEYSMLPYSTSPRKPRDITKGRPDGRGTEIQRLIGRSLRAAVDLVALGPRTLWIDCDVMQAIWNLRDGFKADGRMLVLLTTQAATLPEELAQDVLVLDEPLPGESDLASVVQETFRSAEMPKPDESAMSKLVDALLGLAAFPAEQVLADQNDEV